MKKEATPIKITDSIKILHGNVNQPINDDPTISRWYHIVARVLAPTHPSILIKHNHQHTPLSSIIADNNNQL